MNVKIVDVPQSEWTRCARVAAQFLEDYPDKPIGAYHGCVYFNEVLPVPALYVYKTKTCVVVRNSNAA